jgi:N-acetylated-alpha-linked acidic dipeptidase
MDIYGDPDYQYHITISKIILLLAAKLVEEPVIQFNATDYAFSLEKYTRSAKIVSERSNISADVVANSFAKIDKAISGFREAAIAFDTEAVELEQQLRDNNSTETKRSLYKMVRNTNTRYKFLERSFLHGAGLDNRSWFKHVVFAPGRWTGYAGATLPGLIEALEGDDGTALEKWASIISDRIDGARELLLNSSDRCEGSKRTY